MSFLYPHYLLIKDLHIGLAFASILFFVVRAYWSVRGMAMLQQRWVKTLPHLIDTFLLLFGVTLMMMLRAWPQQQPWLAVKLLALLLYIVLGTFAIKRGRTPTSRAGFALAAILVFGYMLQTAMTKDPLFFIS
ncbi:MAG: SirB2 family protein [Saccharospirillum sp.]|nr:SirB2 family protein [Saccharospirillum sp.]